MSAATPRPTNAYGRLTEVQYYPAGGGGSEDTSQQVTYSYDGSYPCTGLTTPDNTYANARLAGVLFGTGGAPDAYSNTYCYLYAYNQAGRVITQEMSVKGAHTGKTTSPSAPATSGMMKEG